MKKLFFLFFFCAMYFFCDAQIRENILGIKPDSSVTGIKVQKITGDKNSTSYIIWIKDAVKAHRHEKHTEIIYILEGEGEMKMNGIILLIKPGDYVNIPENIVHSVKVTSSIPMKVLSVQSPEFGGDDRIFVDE